MKGKVTHYFGKVNVAVVKMDGDLKIGDTLYFLGRDIDFNQTIESMEIDHNQVEHVKAFQEVAIKVDHKAPKYTMVYKTELLSSRG